MSQRLVLAALLTAAMATAGCAANNARQGGARAVWTPPPQDRTYRSADEASRAYETVAMLAGGKQFRYAGAGRWEILEGGVVVRALVIGGQADIDWNP